ncbi:hypothetical protein GCM10010918_06450 [Paenibacillus radicis (ex Gao et al. 2016)]|uniref:Uncharacterized protein n=2 Tax=Paenibacillus radicis (ex Gao et al. 2016) TaxID=1737354 RepID=A0A917GSL0_9BACL|nr:hypothetical protein GCM10010918_06450 [Paenibacillus radicis (ex Gao et al. 2016)]
MEEQAAGKRSLALPITLVLLVFSLIGNVFFYSQFLQGKQDTRYRTGQHIIETAVLTKVQYETLLNEANRLLELNELGVVPGTSPGKGDLTATRSTADSAFIAEAYLLKGEKPKVDGINTYFQQIRQSLDELHNLKQPMTEQQVANLNKIRDALNAQYEIIQKFNFDAAETRISTIQLASGIDWLELADQLEASIASQ